MAVRTSTVTLNSGEAEIAVGLEMLKATFGTMNQGYLLLDREDRVVSFNDLMVTLVGYPPEAVFEGASCYDLVRLSAQLGHYRDGDTDRAYASWRERLSSGSAGSYTIGLTEERTLEVGYAPI